MLTRSGWRSIKAIVVGDVVASFNIETHAMEWKEVLDTQQFDLAADVAADAGKHRLFRMQGDGMDVIATRDHRMLLARLKNHGLQQRRPFDYETVGDLLDLTYSTPANSTLPQFAYSSVRAVVRSGLNRQPAVKLVIKGMKRVCDWWWQQDEQLGFLRFLGFWLGDGHLEISHGTVAIAQRKRESSAWLVDLLDQVFPRWWYRTLGSSDDNGTTLRYLIRCLPLFEYLREKAAGPPGYNPRDPAELRSYPHFTPAPAHPAGPHGPAQPPLADMEAQTGYGHRRTTPHSWTEAAMLAALAAGPRPCSCSECGVIGGAMLVCSGKRCMPVDAITRAHPGCVDATVDAPWYCRRCRGVPEDVQCCWWCAGPQSEPDTEMEMLTCEGCGSGGHLKCAMLTAVPEGDWLCQDCFVHTVSCRCAECLPHLCPDCSRITHLNFGDEVDVQLPPACAADRQALMEDDGRGQTDDDDHVEGADNAGGEGQMDDDGDDTVEEGTPASAGLDPAQNDPWCVVCCLHRSANLQRPMVVCHGTGSGGRRCLNGKHLDCAAIPVMPAGRWFCYECAAQDDGAEEIAGDDDEPAIVSVHDDDEETLAAVTASGVGGAVDKRECVSPVYGATPSPDDAMEVREGHDDAAPASVVAPDDDDAPEVEDDDDRPEEDGSDDGDDDWPGSTQGGATQDAAEAQRWRVAGKHVWWNNGWWYILHGTWYHLKRYIGADVADTFANLSQQQAVALLDGFCRADGTYADVQYHRGKPVGQWRCTSSSFPLIHHLQLIGQLAGATVDLARMYKAGRTNAIGGRPESCTVDHWRLSFNFAKTCHAPVPIAILAEPVDVTHDIAARGYYDYEDDGKVYDITVEGNSNFLTQRLSLKRHRGGRGENKMGEDVRAQPVFVGNCLSRTYAQVMQAMTASEVARWQCPACVGICTCAACQRRGKETALENVGLPPPLNIPAELLANDPWAYALHSSSTAAQQAQQAAAAAAQALVQQQAAHQQAGVGGAQPGHGHMGVNGAYGGLSLSPSASLEQSALLQLHHPSNPLSQLHQSLAILQSLANAPHSAAAASSSPPSHASVGGASTGPVSSMSPTALPLSGLAGLSPIQLAALNAAAVAQLQQQAAQQQQMAGPQAAAHPMMSGGPGGGPLNGFLQGNAQSALDSVLTLQQQLQLHQYQMQQQQEQQQPVAGGRQSSSPIPSGDLMAAQAAAAFSRERHRTSHSGDGRGHEEAARVSKLGAAGLQFQAPPPFFLSSHAPASPLLHSPTLSRPASPLSPLSPSSSQSPSNSPQVRQRSLANLHKLSTTRNLSLSVPSKTRSLALGVGSGGAHHHGPALEEQHGLQHHSTVPSHQQTTASVDGYPSLIFAHQQQQQQRQQGGGASSHGRLSPIVTAVGGEEMPTFHTGPSTTAPLSVPSRTRTISDRSGVKRSSASGRRSVEQQQQGAAGIEGDSPHSPYSPQQAVDLSQLAQLNAAYPSHLTHLQSMSSRNPNRSLLQQQQQQQQHQHGLIQQPRSSSPYGHPQPRRSSLGGSPPQHSGGDGAPSSDGTDELNAQLQQQMMQAELEKAHRLQLQLFHLQQQQQQQQYEQLHHHQHQNQHQQQQQQQHAEPSAQASSRSSRSARPQSLNSQELSAHNAHALRVLEQYTQASQQQQQHSSPLYQQPQGAQSGHGPFSSLTSYSSLQPDELPHASSSSPQSSSAMFDRQSSFQLPDTMPSFNPFTGRDSSMEPRSVSGLATPVDPSSSHAQSSSRSAHSHPVEGGSGGQLPSSDPSDPFALDNSAMHGMRLSSGGDYLGDLSTAGTMDMSREVSGLGLGLEVGGGGGGGMAFDRSLSAQLGAQAAQLSHNAALHGAHAHYHAAAGDGGGGGAALQSSSQALQRASHGFNAPSQSSAGPPSSGAFEDELNAELFTLHHDRGLSSAGFDLNLERYPSSVTGLAANAFTTKDNATPKQGQQHSTHYSGSNW